MMKYKVVYGFSLLELEAKVEAEFQKAINEHYGIQCLGGVQVTVINNTSTFYQALGPHYEVLD